MADDELRLGGEKVLERLLEDEMRESFIDYSMSVIVQRALPDVRDGLKPVHRRILYGMGELGLSPGRGYKKSATVVGDTCWVSTTPMVIPAIYDSHRTNGLRISRCVIPSSMGRGILGPSTAIRLRRTGTPRPALPLWPMELLEDIDKETVAFTPNFDGRLEEPTVLPGEGAEPADQR